VGRLHLTAIARKFRRQRTCYSRSRKNPRTPTVAPLLRIGLRGVAEADLGEWCNSWRARFLIERLYVAASTQAGPADEDPRLYSHVAARHDPKSALVQSCVPDAGPPIRLFPFRARSRAQDLSKISHTSTCSARTVLNRNGGPVWDRKSVRARVTRSL